MKIHVKNGTLSKMKGSVCILGAFEGEEVKGPLAAINKALGGKPRKIISSEGFTGDFLQTILIRSDGEIGFERLVLVGLGKRPELTSDRLRKSIARGAALVQKMGLDAVSIYCDTKLLGSPVQDLAQTLVEGLLLSLYRFDQLKTKPEDKKEITTCTLVIADKKETDAVMAGAQRGKVIAEGVRYTRDLCSLPSNILTPGYLANEASQIGETAGMSVEILEQDEIKALGMGAFHAVTIGSDEPSKFIIIHYSGSPKGKKARPVALIGKSVTFDTGGISLKPSANMEQMKYDMSGGATVLGVMKILAQLKLPINIVALLPATDNMPSGKAVHPGDVVTTLSGKTVEVINTDAEGRLCLADALSYASRFKPTAMIDLATLTGACVVALGQHAMGLMTNNPRLASRIQKSGDAVGERTWELPVWDDYFNQIEGDVADLKNVGGRGAGTITAALFLKQFVGEVPWVHLDIAGTAWFNDGRHPYVPKGATGIGVRLLIHYLCALSEQGKK